MSWLDEIQFDERGLIPAIAQESTTGEVLMLAYANREALENTIRSGEAHYWSRSRNAPWRKGETSGHVQKVVEVRLDCDGDAVLYRVHQTGAACHTLERSCFHRLLVDGDLVLADSPGDILDRVERVIERRSRERPEGSYTTYLFEKGLDKILKKVGEESTEVIVAAKNESRDELTGEIADLFFHLLVLTRERDLPLEMVWRELEERFGRAPRARTDDKERNPAS